MLRDLCVADVLALASAIGELTTHTRRARTSQWCALQMSSNDMPAECKRVIHSATNSSSPKQRLMAALQAREALAGGAHAAAPQGGATSAASSSSGDANNNMK